MSQFAHKHKDKTLKDQFRQKVNLRFSYSLTTMTLGSVIVSISLSIQYGQTFYI